LLEEHDDAGYYAAVQATGSTTWGGATLFRSPDGGTTYDAVATHLEQAVIGSLVTALPTGPSTIVDEGNELVVSLADGVELESITDAGLLAGLNAAAIGSHGRWEIVQFRTAVQGSPDNWTLTGLLRGRRGTEFAIGSSIAADRFVLLDSAVQRITQATAAIGSTRLHKAVLSGTLIEDTDTETLTSAGVALRPFSVVNVEGDRSGGDLVITWIRRSRLGQELPSGTDLPLNEDTESYDIDIIDTDTITVLRTLTATSQTVTYTAAQQASDFGSPIPDSVIVRIYQRSALVGRGYVTEATL
jgi:hypothetical protein